MYINARAITMTILFAIILNNLISIHFKSVSKYIKSSPRSMLIATGLIARMIY